MKHLACFLVLSVGDALVAQIPALIISVTAGVVVTRVPGESEKEENLAGDIVQQVSVNSRPFLISAALMIVMAIISWLSYIGLLVSGGLPVGYRLEITKEKDVWNRKIIRTLWELICLIVKISHRVPSR